MNGYLYLFFQIWVWILASFILGWVAHWFFCCRGKNESESDTELSKQKSTLISESTPVPVVAEVSPTVDEAWKPHGFTSAPENVDDLKRIKGVGPVIEKTLNGLGIYQFEQITQWDDNNTSWVENFLAFPGRIAREDWIEQSKTLGAGGTTEFAKRVDKGDVDYT